MNRWRKEDKVAKFLLIMCAVLAIIGISAGIAIAKSDIPLWLKIILLG